MVCPKCESGSLSVIPAKVRMKKLIIVIALAAGCLIVFNLAVSPAYGTTRYIAQTAGTFSGGSACNGETAITPATFASTAQSAGDINYLCGAMTFAAGASGLSLDGGGASGNPVQIIFDNGASLKAPYFATAGFAINGNGASYVTINGGTNGVIENTANGTGLTYQNASIYLGNFGNNLQVENLQFLNCYVHTLGDANGGGCWGVDLSGQSNVIIGPGNTFTQFDVAVFEDWGSGSASNLTVQGNSFNLNNQSMEFGFYPAGTFSNVYIYGNTDGDHENWDDAGDDYHHNFVHWFTNLPGATLNGTLEIYNNKVIGNIGATATSQIFLENNNGGTGGTMGPVYVFNNVFDKTNANVPTSVGIVAPMSSNGYLLNNTIIDAGGTGDDAYNCVNYSSTGWTQKNNIFIGCGSYVYAEASSLTATNNDYYGAASPQWIWGSTFDTTLASWQSSCSCDSASIGTNPNLTNGNVPNSGSPVIGTGVNLTSLGITPLDSDITGNSRGSTGNWTMGAYNASGGPPPPTGLTGTIQQQ